MAEEPAPTPVTVKDLQAAGILHALADRFWTEAVARHVLQLFGFRGDQIPRFDQPFYFWVECAERIGHGLIENRDLGHFASLLHTLEPNDVRFTRFFEARGLPTCVLDYGPRHDLSEKHGLLDFSRLQGLLGTAPTIHFEPTDPVRRVIYEIITEHIDFGPTPAAPGAPAELIQPSVLGFDPELFGLNLPSLFAPIDPVQRIIAEGIAEHIDLVLAPADPVRPVEKIIRPLIVGAVADAQVKRQIRALHKAVRVGSEAIARVEDPVSLSDRQLAAALREQNPRRLWVALAPIAPMIGAKADRSVREAVEETLPDLFKDRGSAPLVVFNGFPAPVMDLKTFAQRSGGGVLATPSAILPDEAVRVVYHATRQLVTWEKCLSVARARCRAAIRPLLKWNKDPVSSSVSVRGRGREIEACDLVMVAVPSDLSPRKIRLRHAPDGS